MLQVLLFILAVLAVCIGSFLYIFFHERRTLWSGMTFTTSLFVFAVFALVVLVDITDLYSKNYPWIMSIFLLIVLGVLALIVGFVLLLIGMLIYNGIKIILREGNHWTNYLSLSLGLLFIVFLVVYPNFGHFYVNDWVTYIYIFILLVTLYFIYIMMMYTFTSLINLYNPKSIHLDYVVVLGAGLLNEDQVSPLLAARINRGIEVMNNHPGSKLILSGGQGANETIPEAVAMADYAKKVGVSEAKIIIEDKSKTTNQNIAFSHKLMKPNSKFCLVTNSYHVYRALVLAKRQGLKCTGYGAKTKWYFTLNAFIREFIAYVVITKKLQSVMVGLIFLFCAAAAVFDNLI